MKLPFNWLADFVDLSGLTPDTVAEKLTMGAFEVESIHTFGPNLTGPVVVGEIVDIQPHPNANKIRLTKVKIDQKQEPLEIVCGAQNIAIGQRIPVALPGAIVINRHDGTPLPIKVSAIRGVQSNGMLCSPPELGITTGDSEGILILDPSLAQLGNNIIELLCLKQDSVLTVGSRSNRGDAVCIRGMAREVAALFERPLREPEWQLPNKAENTSSFSINIADPKDCDYFSIRSISDIKVASSPPFITQRLASVGTRPVNNIVDITNYVMHEWGQPMHAYDAAHIKDGQFNVRRGKPGEKYRTLDSKERTLTDEILVITDAEKVVGMPIMGGAESEIKDSTTHIALEAASFTPAVVRRGSRLLGLHSESSLRFERGVDAATTKQASDRATYLISQYCKGDSPVKVGAYTSAGQAEHPPLQIELRPSEIKRYLNLDLKPAEIKDLLSRLSFTSVESDSKPSSSQTKLTFSVPSFRRNDVQREIDLVEEVCRIYGYNNIKEEAPTFLSLTRMPDNFIYSIRQALASQGLCEAYVSSLVPDQGTTSADLNKPASQYSIKMLNPLSPEHQVLRQSLLPGLIDTLKYNHDRAEKDVWLFELGYAYFKHKTDNQSNCPALEELKVAGILSGNRQLSLWQGENNLSHTTLDFYFTKGVLENLFKSLAIPEDKIEYLALTEAQSLIHPGQAAQIIFKGDKTISLGYFGQLHPAYAQEIGIDTRAYLFELDVESLKQSRSMSTFKPISTLPAVVRDLTADLHQSTENIAITNCIKESSTHLKDLQLISIYPLNNDMKSFSYRLTFQKEEETFKSEEVEKIMDSIRNKLKEKLSASFRM